MSHFTLRRKAYNESYLSLAIMMIVGIIVARMLLPFAAVPFIFEEFLFFKGAWWEPIWAAWPLFFVGFVINIWKITTTTNPPEVQENASMIPIHGVSASLFAGIMEEIVFRWVLLYGYMEILWILNDITVYLFDVPILKIIAEIAFGGFTNFIVGNAQHILTQPTAWTIGAAAGTWTLGMAILPSVMKFQQGHLYQGMIGWILSGFAGLVFFRIMFNYGLFAGMWVHFLFDMTIFLMLFVDVLLEEQAGKAKMYQWY